MNIKALLAILTFQLFSEGYIQTPGKAKPGSFCGQLAEKNKSDGNMLIAKNGMCFLPVLSAAAGSKEPKEAFVA